MILATVCSKKTITKDGESIYLVTCEGDSIVWSHEPIRGGLYIKVQQRKAGDKYVKDGKELTVLKDGFNIIGLIGTVQDARDIAVAIQAKAEFDL
jgi:hypothetical protein